MATLRFSVAESQAGSRLDRALAERDEIGTRSLAERLLRDGAVTVDGAAEVKSHRLETGAVVEVRLPAPAAGLEPEPVTVRVVYDDDHLVVVDKPAGITVHPGAGTSTGTLAGQLLTLGAAGGDDRERPGIVHRLDRDTSGLLVVARSEGAYVALQACDPGPRGRATLSRAGPRASTLADRPDRGAGRARPARSDAAIARYG